MRPQSRNAVLLVLAVTVIATAVWAVGRLQRDTIAGSFRQTEAAHGILTAMLEQETSLRGFLQTGRDDFLKPYRLGVRDLSEAVAVARRETARDGMLVQQLIDRSEALGLHWRESADAAIADVRRRGVHRVAVEDAVERKSDMDRLRAVVGRLQRNLEADRADAMNRSGTLSVLLVVGLSIVFAFGGWLGIGRPAAARDRRDRRDARRRDRQASFARSLQFMDSEEETHALVQRHLEQSIEASGVVVLQRNNSADRLEATTDLPDAHPLAAALATAAPRDCLAVRLGSARTHAEDDLLQCTLCGRSERELTTCTPLLVSGEVIGSVLVEHDEQLGDIAAQYVEDTVTQAAPVIANMRNLAIAERRASTDALTGLANRRAIQDTLRRMFAQAARHQQSLAAVALDLDHFKQINDRYGHDTGDDVLAAVAQALTGTLRASDFVGRQGGEEFIVLLPETGLDGAVTAAENLRRAITALRVPGLDRSVTASFGVAVFPEDAYESEVLLRQADRALYTAKHEGRDRVATAATATAFPQPAG
jgi:diguanylate cyclase (GGDEF)-like protein